jgi:hypothetical protein
LHALYVLEGSAFQEHPSHFPHEMLIEMAVETQMLVKGDADDSSICLTQPVIAAEFYIPED